MEKRCDLHLFFAFFFHTKSRRYKNERKRKFMENYNALQPKLGWNWGAFIMPLQFGFGNKAYLALLTLVPLLNVVWMFVTGAQGAQWAYDSGAFRTVEEFNGAMESWNRAGKILAIICAVLIALYVLLLLFMIGALSALFY